MPDLAAALITRGVLTPGSASRALAAARDGDVASAALRLGLAEERALVEVLAQLHGCPGVDLSRSVVPAANLDLVSPALCRARRILPVSIGRSEVVLAMAEPDGRAVVNEVRYLTGRKVLPYAAVGAAVQDAFQELLQIRSRGGAAWRGQHAPALPDKTAAWVGVVKPRPAAPSGAIEVPEAEERMELVGITESMMEAAREAPEPLPAEPVAPPPDRSPATAPSPGGEPPRREPPPVEASLGGPPAPAVPGGEGAGGPRAAAKADGGGPLVLVADDDPEALVLLSRVLERLGCRVIQARDGREALEAIRRERPSLAVLDAMMPGIHGFEVCRGVKDDPELRRTRVVLCSAVYRGAAAADARVAFGADEYLEKPFRVREASRLFREVLAGPEASAPDENQRRERARADWQEGAKALAANSLDEAVSLCRRATEVDPVSAEAHYYLGHALSRQGMLFEAAAAFERAVELRPDADLTHSCLALLYERLGFRRAAGLAWARAAEACRDPGRRERIQGRFLALLRS